jgi:ABC-2 type transport system permease protein
MLIGGLTAFSVIGAGLIVAAFSRTATEAVIFANIPLVLLMFFSGGVFPLPRVPLFSLGGRSFAIFDFLPQTHAVLALNKVLTLGAGPGEVWFEMLMVLALSALFFALGVWVFGARVMRR